jgi:hypothetical protein
VRCGSLSYQAGTKNVVNTEHKTLIRITKYLLVLGAAAVLPAAAADEIAVRLKRRWLSQYDDEIREADQSSNKGLYGKALSNSQIVEDRATTPVVTQPLIAELARDSSR